jgi:Tol biopolymer transport system component
MEATSGKVAYHIICLSVESGAKRQVTDPPAHITGDGAPSVSPDGRSLAFIRTVTSQLNRDIYRLPLSDGLPASQPEPTPITSDSKWISGYAWTGNGQEVVFASDRGGRVQLWRKAVFGSKQPTRITGAAEDSNAPRAPIQQYLAISHQGHRLVYTQRKTSGSDIRRIYVDGREVTNPLISSSLGDTTPQFSPDGTKIAFQSGRSGRGEIWICNADGSSPIQLTSFEKGYSGSPRWSPDGRTIAFDSNSTGKWDIYSVSVGGGKPVPWTTHPATDAIPSWSHDGRWIYFTSMRTGRNEIWKSPGTPGLEVQVTKNGGFMAFESADGKEIYYTKSRVSGLWKMPSDGGEESKILDSVFNRNFAITRRGIYYMEETNGGMLLRFFDLRTRRISTIAPLGQISGVGLAVSPDEGSILYSQSDVLGSDLMLVENFH